MKESGFRRRGSVLAAAFFVAVVFACLGGVFASAKLSSRTAFAAEASAAESVTDSDSVSESVSSLKTVDILETPNGPNEYAGYSWGYVVNGRDRALDFKIQYSPSGEENFIDDEPVDAGSYDVKITREEDAEYAAYEKIIPEGVVITPYKISVSITSVPSGTPGYTYDKTSKTTVASYGELRGDDRMTVTLGYSLNGASRTDGGVEAGEWTVKVDSVSFDVGKATNYVIDKDATATMVIDPKEVSLEWSVFPDGLIYDGEAKTPTATAKGLEQGDECEVSAELGDGDNVNAGSFTFKATSLTNKNYKLPDDAESGSYEISPRQVTLTVVDVGAGTEGYTYDGEPKTTTATIDGVVGSDSIGYVLSYSKAGESDGVSAGVWTVKISNAYVSEGQAGNYDIDYSDEGSMTIDKKAVTVTVNDVNAESGYIYDKTPKSVSVSHTPLVGDDEIEAVLSYTKGESSNATDAGVWTVKIESVNFIKGSADNYSVDSSDEGEMVILRLTVGLEWSTFSADELVYDRRQKTPSAVATGLMAGDECNVSVRLTAGCDNVNVGKFTFDAYSLNNPNYALPEAATSREYEITKRQLRVTAKSYTVVYGEEIADYELIYEGFADGDDEGVLDEKPRAVCTYFAGAAVVSSGLKIRVEGGSDRNYSFHLTDGEVNIGKRTVRVQAEDKESVEGEELVPLTFVSDEIVAGDGFNGGLATQADPNKAGIYVITVGTLSLSESNYVLLFTGATYTVNAKSLFGTSVEGSVSCAVTVMGGVNPQAKFWVVKKDVAEIDWFSLPVGKETVMACRAELVGDGDKSHEAYNVRMIIPGGISGASGLTVLILGKDGEVKECAVRIDGDYACFTAETLGDFVIVRDKTNFAGIIAVLALLAAMFALFFATYMIRRHKNNYPTSTFD